MSENELNLTSASYRLLMSTYPSEMHTASNMISTGVQREPMYSAGRMVEPTRAKAGLVSVGWLRSCKRYRRRDGGSRLNKHCNNIYFEGFYIVCLSHKIALKWINSRDAITRQVCS